MTDDFIVKRTVGRGEHVAPRFGDPLPMHPISGVERNAIFNAQRPIGSGDQQVDVIHVHQGEVAQNISPPPLGDIRQPKELRS
jgi:hypothetical protein